MVDRLRCTNTRSIIVCVKKGINKPNNWSISDMNKTLDKKVLYFDTTGINQLKPKDLILSWSFSTWKRLVKRIISPEKTEPNFSGVTQPCCATPGSYTKILPSLFEPKSTT